jgi:glycerophosphodiester phosphodiesterase
LFWVILQASGQVNITKDNFFHLFTNIYSVSAIIFFIIILAFLIFLEFAFLTFMAYGRIYNTNIEKKEIIKNTFEKIKMLFGVQIIFFIFYFIIMIPVANI